MQAEILIIWPDRERAQELREALTQAGLPVGVRLETSYPSRTELLKTLEETTALAALIVGPASGPGLETLRQASQIAPELLLAAADETEDADRLRAAMRVGVNDYLAPPFRTEEIERGILAAVSERRLQAAAGVVVAFLPAQGGDGASTMALHAAYALTNDIGQPALLADCDLQCGTTVFRLHLEPRYTIFDAQRHLATLDGLWEQIITGWRGLHVLPAPDEAPGLQIETVSGLGRVIESAARRYAYVLADLPPCLTACSYDVLEQADIIHLTCAPALTSLHLARRKIQEISAAGIDPSRVRLTIGRDGKRAVASDREIEKIIGMPIAWSVPNDFVTLSEAIFRGELVPEDSELGRQLYGLAFNIIGQEAASSPKEKTAGWLGGLFARR